MAKVGALGVRRGDVGVVGGATVAVARGHCMRRRGDGSRHVWALGVRRGVVGGAAVARGHGMRQRRSDGSRDVYVRAKPVTK